MDMGAFPRNDTFTPDQIRGLFAPKGVEMTISSDSNDAVIRGAFRRDVSRSGLSVHVTDAVEYSGFVSQAGLKPGLSFIFFLDGSLDIELGDREFMIGGSRRPEGLAINRAAPEIFTRRSRDGQRVRKAVIGLPHEWLDMESVSHAASHRAVSRFAKDHLSSARWEPSSHLVALLNGLIAPSVHEDWLHHLFLECRAIEIVAESLAVFAGSDGAGSSAAVLTRKEDGIVARAEEFIAAHVEEALTVAGVSRNVGASATVLQRLIRAKHGDSLFGYIRLKRLEMARDKLLHEGLTIEQAAYTAGYSSPANFTTAFKRTFGHTPGTMRRGGPSSR